MGIVAYVRNDPVNMVDPDGRNMAPAAPFGLDWGLGGFWLSFIYGDEGDLTGLGANPMTGSGGGGGGGGSDGVSSYPYDIDRLEKCKQSAIKDGYNKMYMPSDEATSWMLSAYLNQHADPAVLGAIWWQESRYSTNMRVHANVDKNGNIFSVDYGPLQLNSVWKLGDPNWQKKYNPAGADLTQNAWASFEAGAMDLAQHGAGALNPDFEKATLYWHGVNLDSASYANSAANAYRALVYVFGCLKERD